MTLKKVVLKLNLIEKLSICNKKYLQKVNNIKDMDKENINSTNIQAIRNSKIKTLFDLNMQNVNVSGQLTRNAKQNTFKVAEPLVSIDNFESIYYKQMSPILTNNSNYQLKSRFIQLG